MHKFNMENLLKSSSTKGQELIAKLKRVGQSIMDRNRWVHLKKTTTQNTQLLWTNVQNKAKDIKNKVSNQSWDIRDLKEVDWKTFLKENKPFVAAGTCLFMAMSLGIYCFASIDNNLFAKENISFVTASKAAQAAVGSNKPTLENIKNIDPSRCIAISGYEIFADGKPVAFAKTEKEANEALTALKEKFVPEGVEDSWFVENVDIQTYRMDIAKYDGFVGTDELVHQITTGTSERKEHVVEEGENLWLIAKKYKIPVDTLIAANPDIIPEQVQIKQKISLLVPKPAITVACKEVKKYSENIPFEVKYEESSNIYKGESTVTQAGVSGERTVKAEIIRVNGKETDRKVLEEKITKEPIKKLVVKGTKNPPPKIGSGSFVRPTSRGSVTSPFGTRWGRMHEGIDIGLPIGTPIKASDGGKVTFSGYKNGYGLCVIISHGGGYSTLYGHCSQLNVKVGASVFQGQVIAKSGNTGRSTGPHLHFEVRKNGSPVNPRNYVKY